MLKIALFLLAFSIYWFSTINANDHKTWFWQNGKKMAEIEVKNGNKINIATNWYENGVKESVAEYKDGKLNGYSTFWYESSAK